MTPDQNRLCSTAYAGLIAAMRQLQNTSAIVPPSSRVSDQVDAALVDLDQAKAALEELIETTLNLPPVMPATERITR